MSCQLDLSIDQHGFDFVVKQFFCPFSQLAHAEEELNESKDLNAFLQDQIDEIKMQVINTSSCADLRREGRRGQYYCDL